MVEGKARRIVRAASPAAWSPGRQLVSTLSHLVTYNFGLSTNCQPHEPNNAATCLDEQ